MSHFTAAVFMTDEEESVDMLLAPYDEKTEIAPYIFATKAEIIREEKELLQRAFEGDYAEWKRDPVRYEAECVNSKHIRYLKTIPDRMTWSDKKLYRAAIKGDEFMLNANGDRLSTYNPDSKWDWYEIGGRWQGMLILKGRKKGLRGTPVYGMKPAKGYDGAFVSDIDFEAMKRREAKGIIPYEAALKDFVQGEAYGREMFPAEADYIKQMTAFHTYAVVTPNGEWHAPGEMGWFGVSSETPEEARTWQLGYYERFIRPAIENHRYMVVVDCHI
jgi:hypothetical protein